MSTISLPPSAENVWRRAGECLLSVLLKTFIEERNGHEKGTAIDKLSGAFSKGIDVVVVIMFTTLIVCCVTQVFIRTVLNSSPPWTEELARYSFMYVNIIAAAICVRKKSHARVTALIDILPVKIRKLLNMFADVMILFVSYVMIRYGWNCVVNVMAQKSPAMRLPMWLVYLCIPVAGVFICFEAAISLIRGGMSLGKEEE